MPLGFSGVTPIDTSKSQAQYVYCGATETPVDTGTGGTITGMQLICPSVPVGPIVLTNRGPAGTGTQKIVNLTSMTGITAWVPFTTPATGGGAKSGDVLTVSGVPAGTVVRLMYR